MTTPTLTTLGLGPAHNNRGALAAQQKQMAERNYAEAADGIALALSELRVHGDIKRACLAGGIEMSRMVTWRKKYADLDAKVRNAIAFAESGELSYAAWEAGR